MMKNPKAKLRIGVIFGGRSGEHEVSIMSAQSVLAALDSTKYDVIQIGITHNGVWLVGDPEQPSCDVLDALQQNHLTDLIPAVLLPDPTHPEIFVLRNQQTGDVLEPYGRLDVVIPVLHGSFGEDGTLQGLLELADLAYVGAGVLGSAVGMDKGLFKDVMRANGIPVVESLIAIRSDIENHMEEVLQRAEQMAPYPLFVKPANLGSSVGITKCQARSDLIEGLLEAARYDRRILIERAVHAREIEVSVLGNEDPAASLPGEIIPSREFYSYEAKYLDGTSNLIIPAPLSATNTRRIQDLAIRVFIATDCAGMARVDFLLDMDHSDKAGEPLVYVSEINTIPGFTKISMYPKLWEASGLTYPALIDRLIELAMARKVDRDRIERRYRREE